VIRDIIKERVEPRDIEAEITVRLAKHQERVAALGAARQLVLLAHGDSWFDYPLDGNGLSLEDTDVIAQLRGLGTPPPLVLNLSHFGEATTDEMGLSRVQRVDAALADPRNWGPSGKPDAILFSGGGNDIVGERFCIYLNPKGAGAPALDPVRFGMSLQAIEASYLDLFYFRDQYAPDVPIVGHGYDFGIPNGVHPLCAGPWVQPSLLYRGWTDLTDGKAIIRDALTQFNAMLAKFDADPQYKFHLVPTQNTLNDADWANELHPTAEGFGKIAQKFADKLAAIFPG
jgi:lysophospholipase L1-like esterase